MSDFNHTLDTEAVDFTHTIEEVTFQPRSQTYPIWNSFSASGLILTTLSGQVYTLGKTLVHPEKTIKIIQNG
jgi:hypothetical protein